MIVSCICFKGKTCFHIEGSTHIHLSNMHSSAAAWLWLGQLLTVYSQLGSHCNKYRQHHGRFISTNRYKPPKPSNRCFSNPEDTLQPVCTDVTQLTVACLAATYVKGSLQQSSKAVLQQGCAVLQQATICCSRAMQCCYASAGTAQVPFTTHFQLPAAASSVHAACAADLQTAISL